MLKTKKSKQIISVIAQIIFVVGILLLAIASFVVLLNIFVNAVYNDYIAPDSDDDIFGPDYGRYWLAIGVALLSIPYFISLVVLLHSGLYSLKPTPFSKAKCLHYISSVLSLTIMLPFIFLYVGIISRTISEEFLLSLPSGDTLAMLLILAIFSSIALDIIGTVLHKRDKKRQLKSADSQKTA
ncbi:MAG: hypothetical protein J6S14_14875 [Clostridia bacterium]|nr:hypothetical protein [Clostridia bacterium]